MPSAVTARIAAFSIAVAAMCTVAAPTTAVADSEAKALKLSQQALKNYMLERYDAAAKLYRQAWLHHHSQHVYLYNAARAAQRAGKLDDAERDYTLFLRNAPDTSPERPKAQKHVKEVRADSPGGVRRSSQRQRRLPDDRFEGRDAAAPTTSPIHPSPTTTRAPA